MKIIGDTGTGFDGSAHPGRQKAEPIAGKQGRLCGGALGQRRSRRDAGDDAGAGEAGGNAYPPPEGCKENQDAEIAIGMYAPYGSDFMDAMPKLRVIGVLRAGLENVDIPAATRRGIAVMNAAGRNANAVSDFTIGMMLAECRSIARSHHDIMQGKWIEHYSNFENMPDLCEKTVGLFGFGHIGKLMAQSGGV